MSKAEKEITESMAIIKKLKPITLLNPMKYSVMDLCAGNALTSVLAVHLLPIISATAIDKKKRKGHYEIVKKFQYLEMDVKDAVIADTDILIAVHPCKTADLIVDLFNNFPAKALIMMPCCNGLSNDVLCKTWLRTKLPEYDLWTYHLAQKIKSAQVNIFTDVFVESPKRNIILARRGK
jgi:hypothetical protein